MRSTRKPPKRILKRPRDPLGGNLGIALFDLAKGGTTLLIVPKVGQVQHLPRGYELDSCAECSSAVWVNRGFMATARRKGMKVRVECSGCSL
jgi:hypothetical protein